MPGAAAIFVCVVLAIVALAATDLALLLRSYLDQSILAAAIGTGFASFGG